MDNNETTDTKVITFCGVQGCCPTATFTENGVELRDDFGGMVKFNTAEWDDLIAKAAAGELA